MRHSVTTPLYRLRKSIDAFLSRFTPFVPWQSLAPILDKTTFPIGAARGWIPLYTMVTFRPDISYATAQQKAADQTRWITTAMRAVGILGAVGLLVLLKGAVGLFL
jgi:kynurenine 3-monooxygenase